MLDQLRVLLVDDHCAMRSIVRSVLRSVGIQQIIDVQAQRDAIEHIRAGDIDLVLVEWGLGRADGMEIVNYVRHGRDSQDKRLPIVLMTAHTERSRVAAARDAGVNSLLRKPISAQTLLERVSAALTDARPFVTSPTYFGPDRRRRARTSGRYSGPFRRATDRYNDDDIVLEDAG